MQTPLTVAYLAFSEHFHGTDAGFTHTYNIATTLARKDVNIEVFFHGNKFEKIDKKPLTVVTLPFPRKNHFTFFPALRAYTFLRKRLENTPIIHERFHVNPIDLLFVRKKKYLLEMNDPAPILYTGIKGTLYRFLTNLKLRRCDQIITQTETLKKILQQFTEKPIHVLPNGVDTNLFRPLPENTIRKHYNISTKQPVIGFLGSFNLWHGVQDILFFAKALPHVTFLLIGNGKMYPEIAHAARILPNIILTGAQPYKSVPAYLAACDILIAPFNPEHFPQLEQHGFWWCPVKLFEYMAMGKPIVSYNYPEVRTIVGNAGLLVQERNKNAFLDALKTLITQPSLRTRLGKSGLARAKTMTWNHRAEQLIKIYKNL